MGYITGEVTVKIGNSTSKEFSIVNKNIKPTLKIATFYPISNEFHSPEDYMIEEISVSCYHIKDGEAKCIMLAPNGSNDSYKIKYYLEWL